MIDFLNILYLFVEVLTELIYPSNEFIEHPYNLCFELFIW